MNIVAFNCGSSTLKFKLLEIDDHTHSGGEREVAHGTVDRIGDLGAINFLSGDDRFFEGRLVIPDHGLATERVINWLHSLPFMKNNTIDAIGHRVVHGGQQFSGPVAIDTCVMCAMESLLHLAPLHNDPALASIRSARDLMGTSIPMVAVFDTTFRETMPDWASSYAIPKDLSLKHRIKRYGFHGLAHKFMAERFVAITGASSKNVKLITLQLGNGCSAAAVSGGYSIDTSMGFTPLEGLMMGTRSGSIDPHLPAFLARAEGVDIETVEEWLNSKSGLLGVSGLSQDMRELLRAEKEGHGDAALAVEMFCYRVRKEIGACLAVLGGADAVVFGGGIGENAPEVRRRICAGMEWCGFVLDERKNSEAVGKEMGISSEYSTIQGHVIPVDEEVIIARDTLRCIRKEVV